VLKLGGVLGESEDLGTDDPRVVVGIGVNAGWRPQDFPPDLAPAMTSLHEASRGRPVDLGTLLDAFLGRLEVRIAALRAGRFDLTDWNARQVTTGRDIEVEWPSGDRSTHRAVGVDAATGGLVVADGTGEGERTLIVGEVRHVRIPATPAVAGVTP
jgi:biotin-(acetyl-CoA carboxylase) ligase